MAYFPRDTDINVDLQKQAGPAIWRSWPGAVIDWDFVNRKYWWNGAEQTEANFTTFNLSGGSFDPIKGLLPSDTTDITLSLAGLGTFYPGTFAAALRHQSAPAATKIWCQLDNGTAAERVVFAQLPNLQIQGIAYNASVAQATMQALAGSGVTTLDVRQGVVFSYNTNDFKESTNGVDATADVAGTLPSAPTFLRIRQTAGTSAPLGWIARVVVFQTAKTQAEVNALSLQMQSGAQPYWTPLDLGAKLKFWVSSDDTINGAVATFTDRVAALALTAVAGAQPVSAAASFNSAYRGLTADAVDDMFTTTSLGGLPTGATDGEIWAVASNLAPGSGAAGKALIQYGDTAGISRGIQRVGVSNVNRAVITNATTALTDTAIDFTGPHIIGGMWVGTNQLGRIDGRDFSPASVASGALATATARLRIFSNSAITPAGTVYWNGVGSDFLITLTLTASEHEKLEGYFSWIKGLVANLPVGHYCKAARP